MQTPSSALRPKLLRLALLGAVLTACGCGMTLAPVKPGVIQSASTLSSFRASQGLRPLSQNAALERAATQQAGFMAAAGRMTHTTGAGRDFASRMRANGITGPRAENVAYAMDQATVFALWENSAPHRRNMLNPDFSHYGLAYATDGRGKRYWALVLGR